MAKELTVKERKLVKAKAEGKTVLDAANEAEYLPNASDETRRVEAHRVLQKPHVQEALQEALAAQGITYDMIVQPVTNALKSDSIELQLKGHDRAVRLLGIKESGSGTTVNNFGTIVTEMRDKYAD